jgi:hypothetical protein
LQPLTKAKTTARCLAGLAAAAALLGVASTTASAAPTILNQTHVTDPTGDSGTGPDLSGMTVTTYSDGTVSFAVQFANRAFLQPNETAQIFVDLNDDGTADLNLSIWPSGQPSYLARAAGTSWTNIRQLPELAITSGSFSVTLALSELQGAAAVPVAPVIQFSVGTWPNTNLSPSGADASDWLPSATSWSDHSVNAPAANTTTTTQTSPAKVATGPATAGSSSTAPKLTIEPIAPLSVKRGKDVTVRVKLKSGLGDIRVFKVCAQLKPSAGALHATQCRSAPSAGGPGTVLFTITYKLDRLGTTDVLLAGTAGGARATGMAVIHVKR